MLDVIIQAMLHLVLLVLAVKLRTIGLKAGLCALNRRYCGRLHRATDEMDCFSALPAYTPDIATARDIFDIFK